MLINATKQKQNKNATLLFSLNYQQNWPIRGKIALISSFEHLEFHLKMSSYLKWSNLLLLDRP